MASAKNEELEIWNSFRNGNERDLHLLYSRFYNDLLRYGIVLLADQELAKEFINTLFLNLWKKRAILPEAENPLAYIITCYKNLVIRRKEKQGALKLSSAQLLETIDFNEASYEETLIELQDHQLLKERITRLLETLTIRQRELLTLRFIEELSYEEIALRLDISVRTVYNSIHSSLKSLKK
jgi:RNA polymerase sigma-70 factor (ECF subfamily)